MERKGWIALDIDGTITLDKFSVPEPVIAYLRELAHSGWTIAMATGRAFCFASKALSKFDFPYVFLPQNGSLAMDMPGEKILFKQYMRPDEIRIIEEAYEGIDSDFVIYAGFEKGDVCYWRPNRLSGEDLHYANDLKTRQKEDWIEMKSFDEVKEPFPLIKCFGPPDRMDKVASRLRKLDLFQVAKIRDPFNEGFSMLLVTDKQASKGAALRKIFKLKGRGEMVIAAGDDENDISLLDAADIKIAMSHSPHLLQEKADVIAPPTQDHGIIHALKMVLNDANR